MEHQPMGCPSTYARSPATSLLVVIPFKTALVPSPFIFLKSALSNRQNIHQQPAYAPFTPKRDSISFQRSTVAGKLQLQRFFVNSLAYSYPLRLWFDFCNSRPTAGVMPLRGTGDLDRLDPAGWDEIAPLCGNQLQATQTA